MNWKPTLRWVGSCYEIINSETRHPSNQYESGFARRLHSATPTLAIVNVLEMGDPTASFWDRPIKLIKAPILPDDIEFPRFKNRPSENILKT
jgi:hypothetical protein